MDKKNTDKNVAILNAVVDGEATTAVLAMTQPLNYYEVRGVKVSHKGVTIGHLPKQAQFTATVEEAERAFTEAVGGNDVLKTDAVGVWNLITTQVN